MTVHEWQMSTAIPFLTVINEISCSFSVISHLTVKKAYIALSFALILCTENVVCSHSYIKNTIHYHRLLFHSAKSIFLHEQFLLMDWDEIKQ